MVLMLAQYLCAREAVDTTRRFDRLEAAQELGVHSLSASDSLASETELELTFSFCLPSSRTRNRSRHRPRASYRRCLAVVTFVANAVSVSLPAVLSTLLED